MRRRVAAREMEADLHMTLSPVTDLSVTADSVATECALSPKAKLSLFDETCFLPEQILLLHKKPCSRLQGTSFHPFQLSTRCMQFSERPLFIFPCILSINQINRFISPCVLSLDSGIVSGLLVYLVYWFIERMHGKFKLCKYLS